jgi:hypothetical protein
MVGWVLFGGADGCVGGSYLVKVEGGLSWGCVWVVLGWWFLVCSYGICGRRGWLNEFFQWVLCAGVIWFLCFVCRRDSLLRHGLSVGLDGVCVGVIVVCVNGWVFGWWVVLTVDGEVILCLKLYVSEVVWYVLVGYWWVWFGFIMEWKWRGFLFNFCDVMVGEIGGMFRVLN